MGYQGRRPPARALHLAGMTVESRGASAKSLGWLAVLYGVQGLPYGFQAVALGVFLREREVDLAAIGFAGALSAPWLLKVLWAPFVDRHANGPLGRRRSWIVPMQVGLAAAMGLAALWSTSARADDDVHPLLFLVFLMNLFAATMDIAVDGLAVDLLRPHQLGLGNAIQVVGYKIGMLTGGGLLVWATGHLGWAPLFWCMTGLTLSACLVTLFMREPTQAAPGSTDTPPIDGPTYREPAVRHEERSTAQIFAHLLSTLRRPGVPALVTLVLTYKLGEALIDPMFGPMLTDHGVSRETIGLWVGTYGMATSIAGSVTGGLIARRVSLISALVFAGALRCIPLAMQVAIAFRWLPTEAAPIAVATEHFFAGMLTTTMFAFMMSRVDRTIGASHYTLLATIEVLGKTPPSLFSGFVAQTLGYGPAFSLGLFAAMLWPLAAAPLARRAEGKPA